MRIKFQCVKKITKDSIGDKTDAEKAIFSCWFVCVCVKERERDHCVRVGEKENERDSACV